MRKGLDVVTRRQLLAAAVGAAVTGSVVGCGGNPAGGGAARKAGGVKVGMVTDTAGIADLSFNMMAWEGLQRAHQELGADPLMVETHQSADYASNLERLAQGGCKVVFAVGFSLESAVEAVHSHYPQTQFVLIDTDKLKGENVSGIVFREQEGAYLVGALAAGMSHTGTLGFVGGMEIPLIKRFEAGYRAGMKTINPHGKVVAKYTNNWEEADKGRELATALFDQGSDVVFHASGKCGLGVIEAARKKGPGFWAIGVDADQDALGTADPQHPQAPGRVLTSMMKRVDNAVFAICKEVAEGTFKAGPREFGVKDDGVGLSPLKYTRSDIPEALLKKVELLRNKVATGEIRPPARVEDVDAWKAPAV